MAKSASGKAPLVIYQWAFLNTDYTKSELLGVLQLGKLNSEKSTQFTELAVDITAFLLRLIHYKFHVGFTMFPGRQWMDKLAPVK